MRATLTIGPALAAAALLWLPPAPSHAQSDDGDRERALELFDQGVEAYRKGNFERSVELMHEAYGLHEEPLLLYNLARAQEQIDETQAAIDNYDKYLREKPDAEDRGAVERRLEILRERLAEERAAEREPEPPGGPSGQPDGGAGAAAAGGPDVPADDDDSPSAAPWIVAGAGVAVVGMGSAFGVLANKAHDDAVDAPVHRAAAASADDADRWALLANITFAVGGAVAAAGIAWGIVDLVGGDGEERETDVSLRVGPGSVGVAGRF